MTDTLAYNGRIARRQRDRGGAPGLPTKEYLSVKRSSDHQSTTDTPSKRVFEIKGSKLVGLASSTAVTLPVTTVVLHRQNVGLALFAGVAPALPLLLVAVVLLSIYAVASLMVILATAIRIVCTRDSSEVCLDNLFLWLTNPPIAFMTGAQLKLPKREAKVDARSATVQPLPAATPGDARNQSTPFFDRLTNEMSFKAEHESQPATPDNLLTWPVRGRHARPETSVPLMDRANERDEPMAA